MNLDSHHPSNDNTSYQAKHLIFMYVSTSGDDRTEAGRFILTFPVWDSEVERSVFRGALGWGHTLFVSVAEQVTALFVAPFCSERKGERSNERGGLWLTICPLGWGLPESTGFAR